MLLFTTFFHGAAPIYAASAINEADAKAAEKEVEGEEIQEVLPIQHEQPKELIQGEEFQVIATIQDAEKVSLYYKQDTEATAIPMERSENTDYILQ